MEPTKRQWHDMYFRMKSYMSSRIIKDCGCCCTHMQIMHINFIHYLLKLYGTLLPTLIPVRHLFIHGHHHWASLKCTSYSTGFFEEAKRDFQQVLKINPDFEEAKVSLLQTLQDQQHRMTRGYWPWWTSGTERPSGLFGIVICFLFSMYFLICIKLLSS